MMFADDTSWLAKMLYVSHRTAHQEGRRHQRVPPQDEEYYCEAIIREAEEFKVYHAAETDEQEHVAQVYHRVPAESSHSKSQSALKRKG